METQNPAHENFDTTIVGDVDPAMVRAPVEPVTVPRENISVYAKGIEQASFSADNEICPFDISLTVSVSETDANGQLCMKSYQVIKRIAFDKVKLLQGAQTTVPVTVVEGVKEDTSIALKEQMKRLAGL